MAIRLGEPCLVVLVGAAGAGKSTWARRWFRPEAIVSADDLRGVVGHHRRDQRASSDAFEVLELIASEAAVVDGDEERYDDVCGSVDEQIGRYRASPRPACRRRSSPCTSMAPSGRSSASPLSSPPSASPGFRTWACVGWSS